MKETFLAHYLISPVTGLYFDGTNFSAKRIADARLFTSLPNMTLAQSTWPGCELRSLTPTNEQVVRILRDALRTLRDGTPNAYHLTTNFLPGGMDIAESGYFTVGLSQGGDFWRVEVLTHDLVNDVVTIRLAMTFTFEAREFATGALNVIARELGI